MGARVPWMAKAPRENHSPQGPFSLSTGCILGRRKLNIKLYNGREIYIYYHYIIVYNNNRDLNYPKRDTVENSVLYAVN